MPQQQPQPAFLQTYVEQLLNERHELDLKRSRLLSFIKTSSEYSDFSTNERARMKEQLSYMEQYSTVLNRRITAFVRKLNAPPLPDD